ncbi:replication initiation protein [Sphaerisporangium album]|uniref:Replication initiation protein n=1 Tax=Sphaerisporangium album TaxID=509200 RepID=A0A367EPR9_9ACTN|nr:replication initiator [Sphaerisporangium album]RCG20074.1 replication initiation protein [Sphaerisporangium album]
MTDAGTRGVAGRVRALLASDVAELVAEQNGVCVRSIAYRVTDTQTGQSRVVEIPCGATREDRCGPCAKRARQTRMAQCREGWHLEAEPVIDAEPPTDDQKWLIEWRADLMARRDAAVAAGDPEAADWAGALEEVDAEIAASGLRGPVADEGAAGDRRVRSTRRRQDAPDLPRRQMADTTLGRVYVTPDGKRFRPSMFLTLTLPSYGRVRDGAPVEPDRYDYRRAARDALHFSKLVDRLVQNLRRVAGFDLQYFATVEPQKRLAPHLHMAIRGTMSRADVRAVVAATYHQVWWPQADEVVYEGDRLPVWVERPEREDGSAWWDGQSGDYVDPASGEVLPTWGDALDELGSAEQAEPLHVLRFGSQVDVQGVLAGSKDADQCIRYLAKYLTKSIGGTVAPEESRRRAHASRLVEALRFEPCAPTCPNWLRYGVQPKGAKAGMVPGRCRGKAHKPEHLGYAGRRVLVSRKWSGKTLGEHRRDRRAWVLNVLGIADDQQAHEPGRYLWAPVPDGAAGLESRAVRTLRQVAERQRWRAYLADLAVRAEGPPDGVAGAAVR